MTSRLISSSARSATAVFRQLNNKTILNTKKNRSFQVQSRLASTLVISEPLSISSDSNSANVPPSTLATVSAAKKLHDGPITLLIVSDDSNSPLSNLNNIPKGVANILVANMSGSSALLAENVTDAIQRACSEASDPFTHVVATASKFGSSFLPRTAASLGVSPVTDVVEVLEEDTFIRPMYAGNALVKVKSKNSNPQLLSIRPTAFDKSEEIALSDTTISLSDLEMPSSKHESKIQWISENVSKSDRPDLGSASIVISGGRGMKNGENFQLLETLADKLGGAVGASRAAVDAGFVPNDMQVGQTGKVVAPDLYIAVGISGAIQHLSGMKDSKTIVAINNDSEAPIFQVADYGLEADLFDAVPELTDRV